jgi:general secretion pathway protein G
MFNQHTRRPRGFTLVEILIVVIILGILAAIVIPQFTNASQTARQSSLTSQLQTIRSQVELYKVQHLDALPTDLAAGGSGTTPWTLMTEQTNASGGTTAPANFGPYLQSAPLNSLNNLSTVATTTSDYGSGSGNPASPSVCGWVINPTTGKIWATTASGGYIFNEADPSASGNSN